MNAPQYKLSKGTRKYIRQEKARIRRDVLDFKEQDKLISELYKRFEKVASASAS